MSYGNNDVHPLTPEEREEIKERFSEVSILIYRITLIRFHVLVYNVV